MFSLILYSVRFFIQFAYPLHDALTSYQRKDNKCFAQLVKYFFMLTLLLLLESLLSRVLEGFLFESVLLALAGLFIYNDYAASEIVFDFIMKKYSLIGGSKLEGVINQASAQLNRALKWLTKKVWKPLKGFVQAQVQRYFSKTIFGAKEADKDSEDERSEPAESEHHEKGDKHGKPKHHKNKLD